MYHTTEQALAAIHDTLTAQDKQFAAFVEAFSELPRGTCLDINPNILDAIEATTSDLPSCSTFNPNTLSALRA